MNVGQLKEALAAMPDHVPVHVAVNSDHDHGGAADTDFLYVGDCRLEASPTQGRMAVIHISYQPT